MTEQETIIAISQMNRFYDGKRPWIQNCLTHNQNYVLLAYWPALIQLGCIETIDFNNFLLKSIVSIIGIIEINCFNKKNNRETSFLQICRWIYLLILDFFFEDQDLVIRSPAEKTIGLPVPCGRLWKRNILLLKSIVSIIGIIEINCFNNIFVLKSTLFTTSASEVGIGGGDRQRWRCQWGRGWLRGAGSRGGGG